jgi:hypothetical protein
MSPSHRFECKIAPKVIPGPQGTGVYIGQQGVMYIHEVATGRDVDVLYQWDGWEWLLLPPSATLDRSSIP